MAGTSKRLVARCVCGEVELEAIGAPIVSLVCHCDDCQTGSHQIEALPGAAPILDAAGGTPYVLYRADRVACTKGAHLLRDYKIREKSTTNRVVASCCNSAMMMRLDRILHWVPVYRDRFGPDAPPIEMRLSTRFKPPGSELPTDVPSSRGATLGFVVRLIAAKVAMILRL